MSTKQINTEICHTTPTEGNVFEDLGFAPTEAHKLKIKSESMICLSEWIKANDLKQEEATQRLHISRPLLSDVICGKADKFSIDALVDMLEETGQQVTLSVRSS